MGGRVDVDLNGHTRAYPDRLLQEPQKARRASGLRLALPDRRRHGQQSPEYVLIRERNDTNLQPARGLAKILACGLSPVESGEPHSVENYYRNEGPVIFSNMVKLVVSI